MSNAEKIGSIKAVTTSRSLPANGTNPVFEVTASTGQGTLAGVEIMKLMCTYEAEMGPNGILYGECPNSGVVIAADGIATFRATGTGTFTEDGGAAFKGVCYFQTSAPSLAKLNGAAVIYDWDVDAEGNAAWELWEWK
ncbi:MAG: hypothetical protein DK302_001425 [Chloroflexi bacterium]|jgi:hypothetical protein|nr:MAG: hypothetical protein DK302_001425 [Chloroflexota bacterium]